MESKRKTAKYRKKVEDIILEMLNENGPVEEDDEEIDALNIFNAALEKKLY